MKIVIDMESDGLLEDATKLHCLCYYNIDTKESSTITDYSQMRELLNNPDIVLIGHNIKRFDIPMFEKHLDINLSHIKTADTLGISWYLYPLRDSHNLAEWGKELGIKKPTIEDWTENNIENIIKRCEEDVKINTKLWEKEYDYILKIYGNEVRAWRMIHYISFKLDCAAEQEAVKWKVDVYTCIKNIDFLNKEKENKRQILVDAMPPKIEYIIKERPTNILKKDGSYSKMAEAWLELLRERNLPSYHLGAIKVEKGREPGNPGSTQQLKSWLDSLGWKPATFKYIKEKDGSTRAIPQISLADGSDICQSVKNLYEIEPRLKNIESYYKIRHRLGLLQGFLDKRDKNDFVKAEIQGFTNTMRFIHAKPCVNLPTLMKAYGKEVREVLIAPDSDHILCGSDISGLEESTKHHYMYKYDPEYVKEMRTPTFDPHIDIAIQAKLITQETGSWYKWIKASDEKKELYKPFVNPDHLSFIETEEGKKLKADVAIIRDKSKKSNFAAVYGAGIAKIALTAGISTVDAKLLHTTYWKRNWSVKRIANSCKVKIIDGQMWLYNPISKFYYSLRYEKDKFSTLNQSSGVYCFDMWVKEVRKKGIKLCGQFHDELIAPLLRELKEEYRQKLLEAMDITNDKLKLNIKLSISIDFGENYAKIH